MSVDGSLKTWSYDDGPPSLSRFHGAANSTASEGRRTKRSATRCRGSMFVETAIGISLAIVVMIAVAQLVAVVAKQRREVSQTRLATQEVANAMERVIVLPWSELTTETIAGLDVSRPAMVGLDDPQWSITVAESNAAFPTKQVEIALSWRDHANRRVEPVRLVAWKHHVLAPE